MTAFPGTITAAVAAGVGAATPANINVGNFDDISTVQGTGTLFEEGASDPGITTHYQIRNRYHRDLGIYMNGVTSPNGFSGNSTAFFQLYAPTLLWIVDWTACRAGEDPDIPNPTPLDTNWILLDVMPQTTMIVLAGDGETPLFRISGRYVYACKNPDANVYENVQYGRPPWIQDVVDRTVTASKLTQGLINIVNSFTSATATLPASPNSTGAS